MNRTISFFAALLISSSVLAQDVTPPMTPMTPATQLIRIDELGRIVYDASRLSADSPFRLVSGSQTEPIILIQDVGDTLGVARQLFRRVSIDSMAFSNIPTNAIEIIPAPGVGRFILPRYMVVEREGTVEMTDRAVDGLIIPTIGFGSEAGGFLSRVLVNPLPNDFNIWDRSGISITQAVNPMEGDYFSTLPTGFQSFNLRADAPLKLFASHLGLAPGMTDIQTWEGIAAKVSSDFCLKITMFYQIFRHAMKLPRLTVKQCLAIAVVLAASAVAHWHLTTLGEGDLFQTAEDILALLLFF